MLEVISATSIQVSWDRLDIPEITRYIVYYSQTGNSDVVSTVPGSRNSMTIDNLLTDVEYQFQVVAVAELGGNVVMGERSNVTIGRPTPPPPTTPPLATTPGTNKTQGKLSYILIIIYIIILDPDKRRQTTVRSNDTLVDTPFQLISGFFHVNQGVLCC